jgi:hypothetical protein
MVMLATDADALKGLPPSLALYLSPSPEIFVVSSLLIFIFCCPSMNLRAHGISKSNQHKVFC